MDSDSTDNVTISIADPAWDEAASDLEALCRRAVDAVLARHVPRRGGQVEVSLRLTDDSEVRELNRLYRNQDKPTNVLSFPADDETLAMPGDAPRLLGDVVVAFGVTAAEAGGEGKSLADHLVHLVVHGMLHLLGFDHEDDSDAAVMEAAEVDILRELGVADPYRHEVTA
jgi:probable rRNA maturation factor